MITSESKVRVLYAHTDKMGIVNNARYLEYFEMGRTDLLRRIGYRYRDMEADNIALPLIEAQCMYIFPDYYDDLVIIKSSLKQRPTVKIKIDYELFVEEKLIATGYTIHSFVDLKKLKPVRPSQKLLKLMEGKL
jgi:acyl-CoA thioester hydrolase